MVQLKRPVCSGPILDILWTIFYNFSRTPYFRYSSTLYRMTYNLVEHIYKNHFLALTAISEIFPQIGGTPIVVIASNIVSKIGYSITYSHQRVQ